MKSFRYHRFCEIVDTIVSQLLIAHSSIDYESTRINTSAQRALNDGRLKKLKISVESLVRDTVAILNGQSRNQLASIGKNANAYSGNQHKPDLTYRIHVKRAYEGMIRLGMGHKVSASDVWGNGVWMRKIKARYQNGKGKSLVGAIQRKSIMCYGVHIGIGFAKTVGQLNFRISR
jgi:hypothetical protein